MLALRYDIKEGIYPAERLLSDPAANVYYRQYAMLTIAKIGNKKEHLSLVEKHIGDDMFVGTHRVNGKSFRIKLGDVALACALHMTGQNLKDYGFNNVVRNNQYLFQPNTRSFPTEAARKKAEAKWRAYKAKQAG